MLPHRHFLRERLAFFHPAKEFKTPFCMSGMWVGAKLAWVQSSAENVLQIIKSKVWQNRLHNPNLNLKWSRDEKIVHLKKIKAIGLFSPSTVFEEKKRWYSRVVIMPLSVIFGNVFLAWDSKSCNLQKLYFALSVMFRKKFACQCLWL